MQTTPLKQTSTPLGFALLLAGLVPPLILVAGQSHGNAFQFAMLGCTAAAETAAFVFGLRNWPKPAGKILTLAAGALLLALVAFVSLVLLLLYGAESGHPM